MEKIKQTRFLRKTRKVGNSCGVLLPKYLLGADVRVLVINQPMNIKKDTINLLENYLEDILGIYLIKIEKNKAEILAISTNIKIHFQKGKYLIDIVPLDLIKKSIKEKKETSDKIKNARVILNKKLLFELKKI